MMTFRVVVITILASLLSLFSVRPVSASDIRVVDIASVTWAGAQTSVSVSKVESALTLEVSSRWKTYTTQQPEGGKSQISFVLGKTLASSIYMSRAMDCDGNSAFTFMNFVRSEVYKQLGISNYESRYLIILAPNAGCVWTGRALIGDMKRPGGVMTLQDSASAFVIVHELGHALGLGHSNFLRCDSGRNDGPWGSDCKAVEYGGTVDVMGNVDVDTPLSTYNLWRLGYLDSKEIRQSWLSESVTLTASDVTGDTRAIFARDGKSAYWIEYRRANEKANYKPGLVIYRTDPPPISAVVSPNPEDALSPEFDLDVTADVWMLNWDNYSYSRSRASGSMTLPEGKTATVFSGNISISAKATAEPNKVEVSIVRRPDTTPPPIPEITNSLLWRFPGFSVLGKDYADGESAIDRFEARISGSVIPIAGSPKEDFVPTYLDPFTPPKNIYLKDLPEGKYDLAIRAIDLWGNRSEWSKEVPVFIDRGSPAVSKELVVGSVTGTSVSLAWKGVKDEGVGLCESLLHNQDGFVLASSGRKLDPEFTLPANREFKGGIQTFDCLGNGIGGEISINSKFTPPIESRRTGKWIPAPTRFGSDALRCQGRCSVSISAAGDVQALIGLNDASISLGGKSPVSITAKDSSALVLSSVVKVGAKKKVLRVSGSNFVYGGLVSLQAQFGALKAVQMGNREPDESLSEETQLAMSKLGFNQSDFTSNWQVLPMFRGTTLLDPTLDLCSGTYSSESGREVRRQISVSKVGSPYLFLSSEAVKYKNPTAAGAALSELKRNYDLCVQNNGGTEGGTFTPYEFQPLPNASAKLVDEKNRVVVRAKIGSITAARQLLAFYQFHESYFTGLYVVISGEKPISDSEVLRWFDVAEVLAKRLTSK